MESRIWRTQSSKLLMSVTSSMARPLLARAYTYTHLSSVTVSKLTNPVNLKLFTAVHESKNFWGNPPSKGILECGHILIVNPYSGHTRNARLRTGEIFGFHMAPQTDNNSFSVAR